MQRIGIPETDSDGTGIGVALPDTGIDFNHPDLAPAPNNGITSYNAFTPGTSCQDDGGHGTHLSGLIAAQNNSIAIVGVAPGAKLYCVKVLDSTISGPDSVIMAGLDWVIQNHAKVTPHIRVVNVSFGRPLDTAGGETLANSPLRPLFQSLYNAGIVVVAAAGNDPSVDITQIVPAGFPEVLAVASTVGTDGIRTCLLDGLNVPNVPADTTSRLQEARGTSFSTPLVTGVVARVMQKQLVPATLNGTEVEGIRTWIKNNASRKGTAPLANPWNGIIITLPPDPVFEGIAQAPK